MSEYAYEEMRRISYGDADSECGKAQFIPVCSKCFRFVAPDATVALDWRGLTPGPNATCKRCGRVEMLFEGFF